MKKLIHYQILPANGCVAIWNTEDEDLHPSSGIGLENQKRFMTPIKYIFTGLCDDGSLVSCGMPDVDKQALDDIQSYIDDGSELVYKDLYYYVGNEDMIEALIRGTMDEFSYSVNEAKEYILSEIQESGVKCSESAIEMLSK